VWASLSLLFAAWVAYAAGSNNAYENKALSTVYGDAVGSTDYV